jgi:phenylalanyl-tRNA synthetase beta chain
LIIQKTGIAKFKITEKPFSNKLINGYQLLINNKEIAVAGIVENSVAEKFDIEQPVYSADINWDHILELSAMVRTVHQEASKFPFIRRDFAFLADKTISFSQIKEIAEKTEKKLLKSVNLFDVYQGENLPEGKKSYAVSFILQSNEKTLSDKEADKIMEKIRQNVERELGAVIR